MDIKRDRNLNKAIADVHIALINAINTYDLSIAEIFSCLHAIHGNWIKSELIFERKFKHVCNNKLKAGDTMGCKGKKKGGKK